MNEVKLQKSKVSHNVLKFLPLFLLPCKPHLKTHAAI